MASAVLVDVTLASSDPRWQRIAMLPSRPKAKASAWLCAFWAAVPIGLRSTRLETSSQIATDSTAASPMHSHTGGREAQRDSNWDSDSGRRAMTINATEFRRILCNLRGQVIPQGTGPANRVVRVLVP